jgi:hypothetical protein
MASTEVVIKIFYAKTWYERKSWVINGLVDRKRKLPSNHAIGAMDFVKLFQWLDPQLVCYKSGTQNDNGIIDH